MLFSLISQPVKQVRALTLAVFSLLLFSMTAQAADLRPIKFCVWDPVGKSGPFSSFLRDTKGAAIGWGIDLIMEAYTDEKVASNDFKSGICDAVFLTNVLGRDFIPFTSAFGSPGGVRSLDELKTLAASINSPKARKLIQTDQYELSGIFPIGEIYTFLRDKGNVGMANLSGKKIAVLNADVASAKFVETVGGSPVHTTLATWSGQFNNGGLDVMFAPTLAYNTFELYQGLGTKGAIVKYNILYAVMQMIVNRDKVPDNFAPLMRDHALSRFDELETIVRNADQEVDKKYWLEITPEQKVEYEEMSRRVRLELRDEGKYDPKAVTILWKIRCKFDPAATECATPE